MLVALHNRHDLSPYLLDRPDLNINATQGDGTNWTALHFAVMYRRFEVARQLIHSGADMDIVVVEEDTARSIIERVWPQLIQNVEGEDEGGENHADNEQNDDVEVEGDGVEDEGDGVEDEVNGVEDGDDVNVEDDGANRQLDHGVPITWQQLLKWQWLLGFFVLLVSMYIGYCLAPTQSTLTHLSTHSPVEPSPTDVERKPNRTSVPQNTLDRQELGHDFLRGSWGGLKGKKEIFKYLVPPGTEHVYFVLK